MKLTSSYQRHNFWHDIDAHASFFAFAAVLFFITTLAVYLYAATQ